MAEYKLLLELLVSPVLLLVLWQPSTVDLMSSFSSCVCFITAGPITKLFASLLSVHKRVKIIIDEDEKVWVLSTTSQGLQGCSVSTCVLEY